MKLENKIFTYLQCFLYCEGKVKFDPNMRYRILKEEVSTRMFVCYLKLVCHTGTESQVMHEGSIPYVHSVDLENIVKSIVDISEPTTNYRTHTNNNRS